VGGGLGRGGGWVAHREDGGGGGGGVVGVKRAEAHAAVPPADCLEAREVGLRVRAEHVRAREVDRDWRHRCGATGGATVAP